jgi:hypothetical protein
MIATRCARRCAAVPRRPVPQVRQSHPQIRRCPISRRGLSDQWAEKAKKGAELDPLDPHAYEVPGGKVPFPLSLAYRTGSHFVRLYHLPRLKAAEVKLPHGKKMPHGEHLHVTTKSGRKKAKPAFWNLLAYTAVNVGVYGAWNMVPDTEEEGHAAFDAHQEWMFRHFSVNNQRLRDGYVRSPPVGSPHATRVDSFTTVCACCLRLCIISPFPFC